jgi:hypothetical protein
MPTVAAEYLDRLHRAGWSLGDTAFHAVGGGLVWVVSGRNGENQLRAEGAISAEAWEQAVEQARSLGMSGGINPSRAMPGQGGGYGVAGRPELHPGYKTTSR